MRGTVTWFLLAGVLLASDDANCDAIKAETKNLEDTWVVESVVRDPREKGPNEGQGIRCVIKSDKALAYLPGQTQPAGTLAIKFDPTKAPKTLDLKPEGEQDTVVAIYELKDDTLRVCSAPLGKPRPNELSAKAGTGQSLVVLKRHKP